MKTMLRFGRQAKWTIMLASCAVLLGGFRALATPATGDNILQRGLALWQQPDKDGHACASCHSPDGIELAAYDYDPATLVRRASPHLGASSAQVIAKYIAALRKKLDLPGRLDPMQDRPLQPGRSPLPGKTATDRDDAFASNLPKLLPRLTGDRIATLADAKAALSEVLKVDPMKVRIGIVFNRLSEDKFHGDDHASLAHWIPDIAPLPYSPTLREAQTRYLAQPTQDNLEKLSELLVTSWTRTLEPANSIALEKARALLVLQHMIRTGSENMMVRSRPDPKTAPTNPYWEIGDTARIYESSGQAGLDLPPSVLVNKTGGPSLREQMREMRLPWLWLGWMADPGLQLTSYDRRTRSADWFAELLLDDGPYPCHAAFMLTKKIATSAYDPASWASSSPQHLVINYSWLLREANWRRYEPQNAAARKVYDSFLANSFRMFAILQTAEITSTGVTYQREPLIQQLADMRDAAVSISPKTAALDRDVFSRAISVVQRARLIPS